jgi:hypothetical protein
MNHKRQKPEMTRKEALAVLHKVQDAVGGHLFSPDATEECKMLADQVFTAFRVLNVALLGEWARYSDDLCEVCYLRRSIPNQKVSLKNNKPYLSRPCCPSCLEQLQNEQQVAAMEYWEWDTEAKKWNVRKEQVQA